MTDEKVLLAQKIKNYRKETGLSQIEFAEECGISKDTISLIERARNNSTLDTIQLLAARMGVTVSDLFEHSPITYCVVPGETTIENEVFRTYGIAAVKNGVIIKCIPDISADFNKVKSLALMCTENNLSLLHLEDIVEDFLS